MGDEAEDSASGQRSRLELIRVRGASRWHCLLFCALAPKPNESYALYLPSYYIANRKRLSVYAFDPDGHGEIRLNRMQDAAERFGRFMDLAPLPRVRLLVCLIATAFFFLLGYSQKTSAHHAALRGSGCGWSLKMVRGHGSV